MCLCRDKPVIIYDNFVGLFGAEFKLDGESGGKDGFAQRRSSSGESGGSTLLPGIRGSQES